LSTVLPDQIIDEHQSCAKILLKSLRVQVVLVRPSTAAQSEMDTDGIASKLR
jgi:hypothetical protein